MGQVVGDQPALPRRLQPAAVDEWRAPDVPDEPCRLADQVLAVFRPQGQIGPAQAQRADPPIPPFPPPFLAAGLARGAHPFPDHPPPPEPRLAPLIPAAA